MNHKRTYLSTSALKAFAKSPNHYIQYVNQEQETTPAMALGTAIHCRVLEPKEYEKRYVLAPKVDRRTKAGKEEWAQFVETAGEREVLTHDQWNTVEAAAAAVWSDPIAGDLLSACTEFEQTGEDRILDVPYRGIADALGAGYIVDLKTTTDASAEAFTRQAHNLMYHEQGAAYKRIFDRERFYIIAVETSAPYNTQVFLQDEESGRRADRYLLEQIHRWKNWNGEPATYSNEVTTLSIPRWA